MKKRKIRTVCESERSFYRELGLFTVVSIRFSNVMSKGMNYALDESSLNFQIIGTVNDNTIEFIDQKKIALGPAWYEKLERLKKFRYPLVFRGYKIPEWIGDIPTIEEIKCGPDFNEIPCSIGKLQRLKRLYLSENEIKGLPQELGLCKNLEVLDLSENQIESLPQSLCNLTSLRELYIQKNKLRRLPDEIGNLKSLQILNAEHNSLTNLPSTLGDLVNLHTLDLSANQILTVPENLKNLNQLTKLNLSENQIEEFPRRWSDLSNLKWLAMSKNRLKSPSNQSDFHFPPNLETFYVDFNRIRDFPTNLCNLQNLREISLAFNDLSNVPSSFLDNPSLQYVYLQGNHFVENFSNFNTSKFQEIKFQNNRENELDGKVESVIHQYGKRCWKPVFQKIEARSDQSKYHGLPYLRRIDSWPVCPECKKPFLFQMQINLAELPPVARIQSGLNATGIIQLFTCSNFINGDDSYYLRVVPVVPGEKLYSRTELKDFITVQEEKFAGDEHYSRNEFYITGWKESSMECERWHDRYIWNWEDLELTNTEENEPHPGDKLGGCPAFIQDPNFIITHCPICNRRMTYIYQMDSDNQVPMMLIGDGGIGYIFQCAAHPNVLLFNWAGH